MEESGGLATSDPASRGGAWCQRRFLDRVDGELAAEHGEARFEGGRVEDGVAAMGMTVGRIGGTDVRAWSSRRRTHGGRAGGRRGAAWRLARVLGRSRTTASSMGRERRGRPPGRGAWGWRPSAWKGEAAGV
uniref:Uncharacterized protein n=1 Tax=Zea mays TaxID=4577 RepID=A0A804NP75_MAIZE